MVKATNDVKHFERLSALADGELSQLEIRQVLRDVDECEQSKRQWRATHLLRSVASKERLSFAHIDISAAVSAQIANEKAPAKRSFAVPEQLGKFAIAASVTMAAILGFQFYDAPVGEQPAFVTNGQGVDQLNRKFGVPSLSARTVSTSATVPTSNSRVQLSQAELMQLQRALGGMQRPSESSRSHVESLILDHAQVSSSIDGHNLLYRARFPQEGQDK